MRVNRSWNLPPGGEQAFDTADDEAQDESQGDRGHQRREDLWDDVKAAGLEDRVAEPFLRRHELADDGADQREADRQLEPREDVAKRRGDDELREDMPLGGAQGAHQVDLV